MYSAATGVLLVYYPFGNSTAELLIPAAATYVAMLRLRQHATTLAWLCTFSFLLYWYRNPDLQADPNSRPNRLLELHANVRARRYQQHALS